MHYSDLIGQTLDDKYSIERELGHGGMGAVFLAMHLGTERPVAIKIIAPQFMKRPEFVERFRREARAAGRLRHPNVVDVTDFGFARTDDGQVAYLVMEYLDGCTLGEILEEEKNLPVGWTLDILEQVCSAVHEAHEQGIIHRDLKPDNIWLEPNQRGGYTVKVLDFGIAKLEAVDHVMGEGTAVRTSGPQTKISGPNKTLSEIALDETIHDSALPTRINEAKTARQPRVDVRAENENETLLQHFKNGEEHGTFALKVGAGAGGDQENVNTVIEDVSDRANRSGQTPQGYASRTSDLTRVGSVLGTPLYMSPEQCRGDKLDSRSDIYSLGVIAYQMLSGDTPFRGDFSQVMESHKLVPPPPLQAKKVRKKLKRVINNALAKEPDDRPQTAEAFATSLRSRSEGIFGLLRRSGMIWTEHIQKFLTLATFFFLPMIVLTIILVVLSFLKASEMISSTVANVGIGFGGIANFFLSAFGAYLITGTIAWIVSQSMAVPLRPIKLRASLVEARKKWRTFLGLGIFSALVPVLIAATAGAVAFGIPAGISWIFFGTGRITVLTGAAFGFAAAICGFFLTSVWLMLVAPVVMMESMRGFQAIKRSKALISRSLATAFAAYIIMFMIPVIAAGTLSFVISMTAKALDDRPQDVEAKKVETTAQTNGTDDLADKVDGERNISYSFGTGRRVNISESKKDVRERLKDTFLETILQILLLPIQIVVISFTAIIVALLYLKTRQVGGESLQDLLARFEDSEHPRKRWQERVRQRLIQSGRTTGRT